MTKDHLLPERGGTPLITLEKCAGTSTPIAQVDGLLERCRLHGHLVPRTLHPWIFSYGDLLKIECLHHFCPQMSLSSEFELLPQLQKWCHRCYVACGKKLTTGGTSAALVTLNRNYPRQNSAFMLHLCR
jgi:hypothetical protein